MQGTVKERLNLKELIEKCVFWQIKKLPGVLLWIIRHFIGLLPLPLLSDYADGKFFNWKKLSRLCKRYLTLNNEDSHEEYKLNTLLMQLYPFLLKFEFCLMQLLQKFNAVTFD